jgi:8-oxo-dGTP pyrophosphatase MutT (NUDIX family)
MALTGTKNSCKQQMSTKSLMDDRTKNEFLLQLKERLQGEKPGLAAQLRMIPNPRPGHQVYSEVEDSCLKAGVLILIYEVENQFFVALTRRTTHVERHQAQISFPGGRQEPGETLEQSALRETCEELGIEAENIDMIGQLTPLYIPLTNYCIYPFVAHMDSEPLFKPSPYEVSEILEVPLSHLLDPQTAREEVWTLRGKNVEVPFFFFDGHKIWGATAMVLAEFIEVAPKIEEQS